MLNNPDENKAVDAKIRDLYKRAAQQPVSYISLYREAIELAEEQFKRAMAAEARLDQF